MNKSYPCLSQCDLMTAELQTMESGKVIWNPAGDNEPTMTACW